MKNKKNSNYLKLAVTVAIVIAFIWFIVFYPYIDFKSNEKKFEDAARRYFDIYKTELPTGNRVKTLTLQDLAHKSFLKEDIYITYSKEPCDLKDSWVKVRQVDGEYKYYVYLQCGVIKSKTDHKGPEIILNGEDEITIYNGDKYKELGVKKVTDETDGTMDVKEVKVDSSAVNTSKNGTYKVTYTISDGFNNETKKERVVNVIQPLSHVIKKNTKDGIYKGEVQNNYIKLSNILFRIVGQDGKNVKLVTANDIANVNYDAIGEWLEYFYDSLMEESKKYIVKNKYCDDSLSVEQVSVKRDCNSKTRNKKVYILSSEDMVNSVDENGKSYLYPDTINWISNKMDKNESWTTRSFYIGIDSKFLNYDKDYNFGVRPLITVKGDSLITDGDGTINSPYVIGDTISGKVNDYVNTRFIGEYINISGKNFIVIGAQADGTTKVIAEDVIEYKFGYDTKDEIKVYNPKQKGNVGYIINNKTSEYIDAGLFVNKEINVPIYKNIAIFGKEKENKKYKVKFSAPNMYELFSASLSDKNKSYWLINSSEERFRKYIVSDNGTVYYEGVSDIEQANIRPVGYLSKDCKIISGSGTKSDPYKIVK